MYRYGNTGIKLYEKVHTVAEGIQNKQRYGTTVTRN